MVKEVNKKLQAIRNKKELKKSQSWRKHYIPYMSELLCFFQPRFLS